MEAIADQVVETDVLVVGGGIAGCPCAWKAADAGLDVILVDKAKPERSGSASQGLDEVGMFPRDGYSAKDLLDQFVESQVGGAGRIVDPNIFYTVFANSLWALEELERMGVNMRYVGGEYGWQSMATDDDPVGPKVWLRVRWQNVKPEMGRAVRKSGVRVFDRTMITDLLTDNGRVTGATAVNTRTGAFVVFKAKAVVLATGHLLRHYNPLPPTAWKLRMHYYGNPASASGDGHAAAYRAGASLARMEVMMPNILRDDHTVCGGQFFLNDGILGKAFTRTGKEIPYPGDVTQILERQEKNETPLYLSLAHLPDDFQRRLEVHLADEKMLALKFTQERGFNPRSHWFQMCGMHGSAGASGDIVADRTFATGLEGLWVAGDCGETFALGAGAAFTAGVVIGAGLREHVAAVGAPAIHEEQVAAQKAVVEAPLKVRKGIPPMELECAVRAICEEYAGAVMSEGMLEEGLRRLATLRREVLPKVAAPDPHYLMRALEVRNILELAELHLLAALERRESRAGAFSYGHFRSDYPDRDPSLDNLRTIQRRDMGRYVIGTEVVPELDLEGVK